MAGAVGAVFGEVLVPLFVAGAVFREIWNDSRNAKRCIFEYKMLLVSAKNNLGWGSGCGLTGSWSDHSEIMLGSFSDRSPLQMTFHLFSPNFSHILDGHFSWQAQYLKKLDCDSCCSAHCK